MYQIDRLIQKVHNRIDEIMKNDFFTGLSNEKINFSGYQLFVKQKYGAVAYFLDFLKRGAELALPFSRELHEIFYQNYLDEIGFFAGKVRDEYSHENWRIRTLRSFGITKEDLNTVSLFNTTTEHEKIMTQLPTNKSFLELSGALLFLEIFVVHEMKQLISAFERDLPELFLKGGYDYEKFPLNEQEYWYNHALHDIWHFRQIKEGLQTYLEKEKLNEDKIKEIEDGIDNVFKAKSLLYSRELFDEMKKA
jgi:thiaminase